MSQQPTPTYSIHCGLRRRSSTIFSKSVSTIPPSNVSTIVRIRVSKRSLDALNAPHSWMQYLYLLRLLLLQLSIRYEHSVQKDDPGSVLLLQLCVSVLDQSLQNWWCIQHEETLRPIGCSSVNFFSSMGNKIRSRSRLWQNPPLINWVHMHETETTDQSTRWSRRKATNVTFKQEIILFLFLLNDSLPGLS